MSELNRDAFEVWAIKDAASTDKMLKFERGGEWYLGKDHQVMNLGWAAWQASRESLVIELPPLPAEPEEPECAMDDSHMDAYHAAGRMRNACAKAIEVAGGKVKP